MAKSDTKYENELKGLLEEMGYVVIRSAGSLGEADLVVINPQTNESTIVEVKSVKESPTLYVSRYDDYQEQFVRLRELTNKGVHGVYSVRWKNLNRYRGEPLIDKWDVFEIDRWRYAKAGSWPIMRCGEGRRVVEVFPLVVKR